MTLTEQELRRYLKKAVGDARSAVARAEELEARAREPIAIVGIACRFAGGVTSAEDLWHLVAAGGDGIVGLPDDRGWDFTGIPVRAGGFLRDVGGFDAAFFGISPREALTMDPQQRLLLELVWEAVEHAGIAPSSLRGEPVGTFVGTTGQGYVELLEHAPDRGYDFLTTSNTASVLSGRVAYQYGFEGPALTVDTACSSSLVALHLAVQSLRLGECSLALACGATVLTTPLPLHVFGRQGGLARDGRSKAFSAAADGMGVGEGVGVVVVERLSEAQRRGHEVLAVVAGSAVNQDGASNGLTAPNGLAQRRVVRAALASAGLGVGDVDLVEAHGTGTVLGDPIEAEALLATYGQRTGEPLQLGSVKSNIGHAQAAAGLAGVIKAVMALRHGVMPPTLHVGVRSDHVDWGSGAVELLAEARSWPAGDRRRRAGVSSFGISGTNAHVILEEAPAAVPCAAPAPGSGFCAWPISGRGEAALTGQTARLLSWLAGAGVGLTPAEVGAALARRTALPDRAVVWGTETPTERLKTLLLGGSGAGILQGRISTGSGLVWAFSGQGGQRTGMGLMLAERFAVFGDALDEVEAVSGIAVRELLAAPDEELAHTATTQPAVFALQVALARLWESWGVVPDAVVGHSVGELAAVHVADGLSLEVACALVRERARLMGELPRGGAMLAVAADEPTARDLIGNDPTLAIAAVNGPASTVVSGTAAAVDVVAVEARLRGLRVRRLRVSNAFHSPAMDAVLDEFRAAANGLLADVNTSGTLRFPVMSTVTGEPVTWQEIRSPEHWVRQLRGPVLFADAVGGLLRQGMSRFLEIGPDASLVTALSECGSGLSVSSQRSDRSDLDALAEAAARLFVSGTDVDWAAVNGGARHPRVPLPTYAFQHTRYWLDPVKDHEPAGDSGSKRERRFWERIRAGDGLGLAAELGLEPNDLAAVLPALAGWADASGDRPGLRYRVEWTPASMPDRPADDATILLVTDCADLGGLEYLPGLHALPLRLGGDAERVEIARSLRAALVGSQVDCVVAVSASRAVQLAIAQAITDVADALGNGRLWVVTRGAVGLSPGEAPPDPLATWAWGFWASVAKEHPHVWGGIVDLPTLPDRVSTASLVQVLTRRGTDGENQLALRPEGVFARRLRRQTSGPVVAPWRPRGTVLVTGGTGYVGGHMARWAARRGAPHLVLVGLDGDGAPGTEQLVEDLRRIGTRVSIHACNVGDRIALADVLASVGEDPPLDAIIHAAGALEECLVDDLTTDRIARASATKVTAAQHLHDLTVNIELSAFLVCSSFPGIAGSPGRAAYSGANAELDALAHRWRVDGEAVTCVVWGRWDGPAPGPGRRDHRARDAGVVAMQADDALVQLGDVVDENVGMAIVADIDWKSHRDHTIRPDPLYADLLSDMPPPRHNQVDRRAIGDPQIVLDAVRRAVAEVLALDAGAVVGPDDSFLEIGFTSLTATELRNRVVDLFAVPTPVGVVFDTGTAARLASWITQATCDTRPNGG